MINEERGLQIAQQLGISFLSHDNPGEALQRFTRALNLAAAAALEDLAEDWKMEYQAEPSTALFEMAHHFREAAK